MSIEKISNLYALGVNILSLVICMFCFIAQPKRGWLYGTLALLTSLISNYYWCSYLMLLDDYPSLSSVLAYSGWNTMYLFMLLLTVHFMPKKFRFHPLYLLVLVPIPLNIFQFYIYLPFCYDTSSLLITIWQCVSCTLIVCGGLYSIVHYLAWKEGPKPYIGLTAVLYVVFQFAMWTVSCFDWPSELLNPYIYCGFLYFSTDLMIAWAINKSYKERGSKVDLPMGWGGQLMKLLQIIFVCVLLLFCGGGVLLGSWMRDQLIASVRETALGSAYGIIEVQLFIFSFVVTVFALSIMMMAGMGQKAAESNELRRAKSIAEHSNAAKSDFLASMSHEIRTPINAVLGMNEIVLRESLRARDQLPPERETIRDIFNRICSYSGNIGSAGNNLLSIINDILDFSKIEAGKVELVLAPYKLSSVLNDVSCMFFFRAQTKGLEFQVDVDESLPDDLYGDEVRIRQIITNLLSNAVKYTDQGSIKLTVNRVDRTDTDPFQLRIAVKDTGIGIREEDLARVFSKFERMDLTHNSTVEGTGLGLAITKSLLGLMNGTIQVESTYGQGSTFTVCIPQKVLSDSPVGNFQEKFQQSMQQTHARRESFRAPDAHVLVVDDTRMNITVVEGLLQDTGIVLDGVLSGEEAIELCRRIRYDVILMDQRMPNMDGTEAVRHIRADGLNKETPVICLTADAIVGARDRYLAQGFTDYLSKPANGLSLEQKLLDYLPQEKIQRTLIQSASLQVEAEDFSALRAGGIQSESGLRLCQNDETLYRSLIAEFVRAAASRQQELNTAFETHDWQQYSIHVHALKSNAKMLGANELSELAAELEAAADSGQTAKILNGHPQLMVLYDCAVTACTAFAPSQDNAEDDPDILEFMPE